MGDRSNIAIYERTRWVAKERREVPVVLYSHWMGADIIKSAVHGLESGRVSDPAYLARVIFTDMVTYHGEEVPKPSDETGFGISTAECDQEHPTLVISYDDTSVEPYVYFVQSTRNSEELSPKLPARRFVELYKQFTENREHALDDMQELIHHMEKNVEA